MEPNNKMQIIAKKLWHMLRVAIFMVRKGILKSKLLSDLNIMMKRGKIAGKAIHNLMFHQGQQWAASTTATTTRRHIDEYEFSCSNTPAHPFNLSKRKNNRYNYYNQTRPDNVRIGPNYSHMFSESSKSPLVGEDEIMTSNVVMKALELMHSEAASPALPGFGRSPMVRQLRITDSPFPLNYGQEENSHVDEAAENFIQKFYKDLRKQNLVAAY